IRANRSRPAGRKSRTLATRKTLIHTISTQLPAIIATFATTLLAGCQQTSAHRSKPTPPNAEQARPAFLSSAPGVTAGSWTSHSPMKQGAAFAGTVVLPDGRLFVISGRTNANGKRKVTNAVRVYDPLQKTWGEVSPIPTPRTEPGTAYGGDGR